MSRLFHLNAHLMHLLSEFYTASSLPRSFSRSSSRRRTVATTTTRSMSAQRPQQQQQRQPGSATQTGSEAVPSAASTSPARQAGRALVIAHPNTPLFYTHINIEPYMVVSQTPTHEQRSSARTNGVAATTPATTPGATERNQAVNESADEAAM